MTTLQELSDERLDTVYKAQVNWFFWIAGLTAINSIVFQLNQNLSFVIGLGITRIFDYASKSVNGELLGIVIFLFINLLIISVFVLFGILSRKKKFAALIVGIILYSIDTILVLIFQEYLSFGFHLFALFFLIAACKNYKEQKKRRLKSDKSDEAEKPILELIKNIKTMNGDNIGINYNIDENKITQEYSKLKNNCSMILSLTIDGKTETKNFYEEIDLSNKYEKKFIKDGLIDLELFCHILDNSIITKIIKYSNGKIIREIEEEFVIGES